ncbi:MAG: NAD(+) synthase [Sulfurovaceae bacterium]|nr:NAD(+) synthase [Sulfurovaceae bacterium]
MFGFYRVSVAVPQLHLGNTSKNASSIINLINTAKDSSVLLFPELCLSGYSAGDLFFNQTLLDNQIVALKEILNATKNNQTIVVVGMAIVETNRLYNCAIVIQDTKILGVVPKTYLPNKKEFYEKRHFVSGKDIKNRYINLCDQNVPFGVDLIFKDKEYLSFGIEICEDLWTINPPSNQLAINGATLILNLSASNELIGKSEYRKDLVVSQSARAMCAYAYSSSGMGESTSETIFGGDGMIAEYGSLLARTERFSFEEQIINSDVDLQKLANLRMSESSFGDEPITTHRAIECFDTPKLSNINRIFEKFPFVPFDEHTKHIRCSEIIDILSHSLIQRMQRANIKKAVIGVSGGLDSTFALLVINHAFELQNWDKNDIVAITMPGFGTTTKTKNSAIELCNALSTKPKIISIEELSLEGFEAIEQDKDCHDVTFENVQARNRTMVLMNMANKVGGLVIGTGDMSEIALGWNTYNGDHMSMYSLNSGIPKTLIKSLIEFFKEKETLEKILNEILNTPVSPELLPVSNDEITQETEKIIGPYELHDFFLYHMLKYGATPQKILFLANHTFGDTYDNETIKKWLSIFIKRFFTQQFKRDVVPNGPKVGTISLNPRADWRMPSDADLEEWLKEIR